jgi:hypothetical protein
MNTKVEFDHALLRRLSVEMWAWTAAGAATCISMLYVLHRILGTGIENPRLTIWALCVLMPIACIVKPFTGHANRALHGLLKTEGLARYCNNYPQTYAAGLLLKNPSATKIARRYRVLQLITSAFIGYFVVGAGIAFWIFFSSPTGASLWL